VHERDHRKLVRDGVLPLGDTNDDVPAADDRHLGVANIIMRTIGDEEPERLKRLFPQVSKNIVSTHIRDYIGSPKPVPLDRRIRPDRLNSADFWLGGGGWRFSVKSLQCSARGD
jgi:hypothetical protein